MKDTYTVHWPRWNSGIWVLVGAALLYAVVDVHFVGVIPGVTATMKETIAPTAVLGAFGLLCLAMGGVAFIRPPLLIDAEPSGIKICRRARRSNTRPTSNEQYRLVPWNMVKAVAPGTIYSTYQCEGGQTTKADPALLMACDPSVLLGADTWYDREVMFGLDPRGKDEPDIWPGSRIPGHENDSHLILSAKYLPGPLDDAVGKLSEMKKRFS